MKHKHIGRLDQTCEGCFQEANEEILKSERRKTVAAVALLIALVIGSMLLLSWYLNSHGPHMR